MSFHLSAGTLDSIAGVFAPPGKRASRSGGGKGARRKDDGTMLAVAIASMLARPAATGGEYRPGPQVRKAFGGGSHAAVSNRAIRTMERTARGVPEVMVRVTGRQHGGGHVLANMTYISRLGHDPEKQVDLHTSEGEVLRDGRDMQELARDWQQWETGDEARRQGATSLSMILSMPADTDPERLKEAALAFAREEFANRSWVAALHTDRDHPHVHLTVARRDHDGRRFHPDRDDLFRYRQRFAQKLRDRGIEANATPARARGIDPKHEPIAARKIREQGAVPQIDKSRADRVRRLGETDRGDPVEAVLAKRQAIVRDTFQRSIDELSASRSLADQVTAQSLKKFVAAIPKPVPNSARAMQIGEISGATAPAAPERGEGMAVADPVAAALARTQTTNARIRARKAGVAQCHRLRQPREVDPANPIAAALMRTQAANARINARKAGVALGDRPGLAQSADTSDPIAAALVRSEATNARINARRAEVERPDRPGRPDHGRPGDRSASAVSGRVQSLLERANRPLPAARPDRAEEIMRKTFEFDREQREHNRSRDRSGPRR
jgi:hypothetical protein